MTDSNEESNHVEIEVQYTKETVDSFIALLRNSGAEYGRREWALEWLQALYPEFDLKLSLPTDTDSVTAMNETDNRIRIDEFAQTWLQEKDTIDISAQLREPE